MIPYTGGRGTPIRGNDTTNYVRGQVCGLLPYHVFEGQTFLTLSAFAVGTTTGGGGDFIPYISIHDLALPLVHVQQDVQFIQAGGLSFQLVHIPTITIVDGTLEKAPDAAAEICKDANAYAELYLKESPAGSEWR